MFNLLFGRTLVGKSLTNGTRRIMKLKQCRDCEETKLVSQFRKGNRKYGKQDYEVRCKICASIFDKTRPSRKRDREKYFKKIAHKRRAKAILRNAVKSGKIKKKSCAICNRTDIEIHGHHPDYNKPLEVIWLCEGHHLALHQIED